MAYDENLADRIRDVLTDVPDLREQKMFGGLAFMVRGHMVCGVVRGDLMLRLGPDAATAALTRPHVRPMDFTGRPMSSMVYVGTGGFEGAALDDWVNAAVAHADRLPPKASRPVVRRTPARPARPAPSRRPAG